MSSGTTGATKDGDLLRPIQEFRKDIEFFVGRTNAAFRLVKVYTRPVGDGAFQRYVPRQDNHRDATL